MLRAVWLHVLQLELFRWASLFRFEQPYHGYNYWTRNDYVEPPNSNINKLNHTISHILINIIHLYSHRINVTHLNDVNYRVVIVLNDVDSYYLDLFYS
jgi:hypothetical protein